MENILQIPVSIAFGYFIDLTMYMFFWVNPQNYAVMLIALLAGCIVLGFGAYIEVLADVVMLPGESFVRAIVQTWNTNFGTTKIIFDSSMTTIAALLVGFIARLFGKHLEFVKAHIFPEDYKTNDNYKTSDKDYGETRDKNVIVIGRQYGSGGHDIGKMFADKLGFDFCDQEIIKMADGTTGLTSEYIKKEKRTYKQPVV